MGIQGMAEEEVCGNGGGGETGDGGGGETGDGGGGGLGKSPSSPPQYLYNMHFSKVPLQWPYTVTITEANTME